MIAERAGVSDRSVYRLVGGSEQLLDAFADLMEKQIAAWEAAPATTQVPTAAIGRQRRMDDEGRTLPAGNLATWIEGIVAFYEAQGDRITNLLEQERDVPAFRGFLEFGRRLHREDVERHLGDRVRSIGGAKGRRRFEGYCAILDITTWKYLRRIRGLSAEETCKTMLELIQDLDGGSP